MKYISVCSGIEAATVAWHPLGWQAAAYSEIEPFPSAVLAHHYPDVPNVGDMTKYKEWNIEPGTVDLLVGGTPCQSFSVAGLRKGLADPRGNLALVYCGILDHFKPRWFVWENVPGVLSSGGGRDFGSFLGAVAELGYGFAYRVLDAQWFGVAQRRRRVFVVGYLGDWRPAAKVLFEPESLRGNPAPSREKGQTVAPTIAGCANGGGANGPGRDVVSVESLQPYPIANTLTARMHKGVDSTAGGGQTPVVTHSLRGEGFDASEDNTGRGTPLVPVAYAVRTANTSANGHGIAEEVTHTLDQAQGQAVAFHPTQDPISSTEVCHSIGANENTTAAVAQPINFGAQMSVPQVDFDLCQTLQAKNPMAVAFDAYNQTINGDINQPLRASTAPGNVEAVGGVLQVMQVCHSIGANENATAAVAWSIMPQNSGRDYKARQVDVLQPLMAAGVQHGNQGGDIIQTAMQVRRLTPVECERLQGFPDNYTAISWRKKPTEDCPDGPRYKALGNSMAVPVMAWIGRRINELEG